MNITVLIVTHNSDKVIKSLLIQILRQSIKVHQIIVVDCASSDNTVDICKKVSSENYNIIKVLSSPRNLGGAGGYRLGFDEILADGNAVDYVLTLDDDSQITDDNYLSKILSFARKNHLQAAGSIVVCNNNHDKTAHNYLLNKSRTNDFYRIVNSSQFMEEVKLFNGTLFSIKLLKSLRGPEPKFFIRGDEVEFRSRIINSGFKTGTCKSAIVYHPDISNEEFLYRGLAINFTNHHGKQYFSTRNRYYIYLKRLKHSHSYLKMIRILVKEFYVYSHFYLINKKDLAGYTIWLHAFYDGLTTNLDSKYSRKITHKFFGN